MFEPYTETIIRPSMNCELLSMAFVLTGITSAYLIFRDEYLLRNRQKMRVMNLVWILTGLWAGVGGLLAYYRFGRCKRTVESMPMPMSGKMDEAMPMGEAMPDPKRSMWEKTALSTLHCGAGCTLADLVGEGFLILVPMSLLWGWTLDYALALGIGVLFQYAAIRTMMKLTRKEAYITAFKIDFWSLTSWQVGMYGWMAVVIFAFEMPIDRLSWLFWWMMQLAMCCGFITAYPTNWLLIRLGIKQTM